MLQEHLVQTIDVNTPPSSRNDASRDRFAISRDGKITPLQFGTRIQEERRFQCPPNVALVIGTFAAVPYVHLQLEARKRYYPDVPMLVHDDCSPETETLARLCAQYGVDFERNTTRFPPCKGDLAAFLGGLKWASESGGTVLVKFSRRFVPMIRWVDGLIALACKSDYATYSSWTTSFNFGFRTECLALSVKDWLAVSNDMIAAIHDEKMPFVEGFMHTLAKQLAKNNTRTADAYDDLIGCRPMDRDGYAPWEFMGTDRCAPSTHFLWHDHARPGDYATLSSQWGLSYETKDFVDPNMGYGNKP